jgi:hypothetical protein
VHLADGARSRLPACGILNLHNTRYGYQRSRMSCDRWCRGRCRYTHEVDPSDGPTRSTVDFGTSNSISFRSTRRGMSDAITSRRNARKIISRFVSKPRPFQPERLEQISFPRATPWENGEFGRSPERAKQSRRESFRPFRARLHPFPNPRALPWAVMFCPFGASGGILVGSTLRSGSYSSHITKATLRLV